MINRRDFLRRSASLFAVGAVVPEFIARTASAAEAGKDTILVVVEMTGGNDGLNTVIPYEDDLYHKSRPTLRFTKRQVHRLNDLVGLHPNMAGLSILHNQGQLATIQGVGYPNPNRSHFESMDIWQTGDPGQRMKNGWLARSVGALSNKEGGIPAFHLGEERLPLALQGTSGGVVSLNDPSSFTLDLGDHPKRAEARRQLLDDLMDTDSPKQDDLTAFVRRRQLQTIGSIEQIREALGKTESDEDRLPQPVFDPRFGNISLGGLSEKLGLVGRLIRSGLGVRVYYVSIDGFDTHSEQGQTHGELLTELSNAIRNFFQSELQEPERVVLMTFSEFGRRVRENGSRGTDHGAASCMFVAGSKVNGGVVGDHPPLDDLDAGDLKYAIDFRQVYATLLDQWLEVDSKLVLGGTFKHLPLLKS